MPAKYAEAQFEDSAQPPKGIQQKPRAVAKRAFYAPPFRHVR